MKEMIAFCGLDCEMCDAYIATKNDDQTLREKTAKLWSELNNATILPEHINCDGCPNGKIMSGWTRWKKDNKLVVKLFYVC